LSRRRHIVIEVIGEALTKPDETFFRDAFNPQSDNFSAGFTQLT
jgi:hypothetical protein